MSDDEKKVADELQKGVDQENKIKKLEDNLDEVQKMLKSIQETASKKDDVVDTVEEIDFSTIDAVEMAKSMADNPEGQKEWLEKFIDHSVINAEDLIDEETGQRIFTGELKKSLEEAESEGASAINMILQTMEANNERMAKRDQMLLAGMAQMAKSFSLTANELVEMKKSFAVKAVETKIEGDLPDLEGNAQTPASTEIGGASLLESGFGKNQMFSSLKKSFKIGMSQDSQTDYYNFADMLTNGASYEDLIAKMTSEQEIVFTSNLEV